MTRLLIHVEGQTEETFVNEILSLHLYKQGLLVSARKIGNARLRSNRGGITPWPNAKRDIMRHLKEDTKCIATTMVDFYGLPQAGEGAWPGRKEATASSTTHKAQSVQNAILQGMRVEMGANFDRFVPFVLMHEFEGLLFSDCVGFSRGIDQPSLAPKFQEIRDQFETPEDINDSPITAPSKRIIELMPFYQKPLLATEAAKEIGLERIRDECPNFNSWLKELESRAI